MGLRERMGKGPLMDAKQRGEKALELLNAIVSEWQGSPVITQHFDLRIVEEATALVREWRKDRETAGQ